MVLLLAAVVTFLTATLYTVYLGYDKGAANLHSWFFVGGPKATYEWTVGELKPPGNPPNYAGYVWTAVGGGVMALLLLAHRTLFWWPVHPVGFLICSVAWTDQLWLTIFLAWLLKLLIVRAGGNKMYKGARKFFLGMVVGQFTVAGVWAVVDTITHKVGNSIFWI